MSPLTWHCSDRSRIQKHTHVVLVVDVDEVKRRLRTPKAEEL
jgi:hypothetical protein